MDDGNDDGDDGTDGNYNNDGIDDASNDDRDNLDEVRKMLMITTMQQTSCFRMASVTGSRRRLPEQEETSEPQK